MAYILRKGHAVLADLADGDMAGVIPAGSQVEYYVDSVNGNDVNDGSSWENAVATIQVGVNLARRYPGTTTIDSTKDHHTTVFVAPGHYNEAVSFSGYNIHLIGCGCPVPGKDYGVSLNYDGAITATSHAILAFSGSGIHIKNLHVYCDAAIPGIYNAGGDNNLIENCVVEGDGTNMTYAIQMESMKGSRIRGCVLHGFVTAGIFCDGGADRYCIHGGIEDCQLYSAVTGAKGIFVESTMTCYNFRISGNFIDLEPAGATAKGIDNDASGNIFITDNFIVVETSATAAESASHGMMRNQSSTNGTVATALDDD